MKKVYLILAGLGLLLPGTGWGQGFNPVQITTQLVPPYSVNLADYAVQEKLRVILLQGDRQQPDYQLRLSLLVEKDGRVLFRTRPSFVPPPLTVEAGLPVVLSGTDLQPYLDVVNLELVGISREQYQRGLPEGNYRICFTAYDYRRPTVVISNVGCAYLYLAKSEPPLLNFPACASSQPVREPQQLVFSWLPRNTASPNSATQTRYVFSLYEVRPAGRNPNEVVRTQQPIYQTTTEFTQLVYGPAETQLLEEMEYVWRVQAVDESGRDLFRNNGFSEVCTFRYSNQGAELGLVSGLEAVAETSRRARFRWQPDTSQFERYTVEYRRKGRGYQWFPVTTTEGTIAVTDLEANTDYEARLQGQQGENKGGYSPLVPFRTLPLPVVECGTPAAVTELAFGKPLLGATAGLLVMASGMEVQLTQVIALPEPGWYQGQGTVAFNMLGGAAFGVTFQRIYLDSDRNVVDGRIDVASEGIGTWSGEQLAAQREERKKRQQLYNQQQYGDLLFFETLVSFPDLDLKTVSVDAEGLLTATDAASTVHTQRIPEIGDKTLIIEDKNGDQWLVKKNEAGDGYTVTAVADGGLSPGENSTASSLQLRLFFKNVLRPHTLELEQTTQQKQGP